MGIDARLDVIGLVVADMAASLAFYRRLGLGHPGRRRRGAARGARRDQAEVVRSHRLVKQVKFAACDFRTG